MKKPVYEEGKLMLWAVDYTIKEITYSKYLDEYVYVLQNDLDESVHEILSETDVVRLVGNPDSRYNVLKKDTLEELAESYDGVQRDFFEIKNIAIKMYLKQPLTKEELATLNMHTFLKKVGTDTHENN